MTTQRAERDLGGGLVLRRATAADTDALAAFNARVHSDVDWDTPDPHVGAWVRDLMSRPHPTFSAGDFLIVEETATGKIVSSTNLIPQTWSYGGIPFGVGRPELVGTHPDYRRRGLVRAQFEVLHRWSAERGDKVQAITGIPWYYRQFGYEMALNLHGSHSGPLANVPALKEDASEPFVVRPAAPEDLAFIARLYNRSQQRYAVSCVRDAALWQYALRGQSKENVQARELCIIEDTEGEPVGFLAHPAQRWGTSFYLTAYEVLEGVSWWAVTSTVMRYLKSVGATYQPYLPSEKDQTFGRIAFSLGEGHPAYAFIDRWLPKSQDPYAWYIRVPDVVDFLRTITPVLAARLASSPMVGHTGDLTLSFYRSGVKLSLDAGAITAVETWTPGTGGSEGMARFPGLTFLQMLFGYRSMSDLDYAFADCFANREAQLLLDVLFPKQASDIWPIS